jgi:hypothetical protein
MFFNAIEVSHLIGHHLMWFLVVWDWSHLICGFLKKKIELKKSNKFFKPVQFLNRRFLPVCGRFSGSIAGSRAGRFCGQLGPDTGPVPDSTGRSGPVFTTLRMLEYLYFVSFNVCLWIDLMVEIKGRREKEIILKERIHFRWIFVICNYIKGKPPFWSPKV